MSTTPLKYKKYLCTFLSFFLLRSDSLPRCPNSLDSLGDADVVGLKLVPAPSDNEDGEDVAPVEELSHDRDAEVGKVVGDARPIEVSS